MDLAHYGVKRKSGRYPWGSGNPHALGRPLSTIKDRRRRVETEIAMVWA